MAYSAAAVFGSAGASGYADLVQCLQNNNCESRNLYPGSCAGDACSDIFDRLQESLETQILSGKVGQNAASMAAASVMLVALALTFALLF